MIRTSSASEKQICVEMVSHVETLFPHLESAFENNLSKRLPIHFPKFPLTYCLQVVAMGKSNTNHSTVDYGCSIYMAAQCSSSTWTVAALGWLYSRASSPKLPSPLYSKTFKRRKIRFLMKMKPSTVAHSHWSWWERDRRLRRQRRRSLRPRPAR